MNNKGFAISGILYTIFILFILTLFGVLSALNNRDKLMSKSIEALEYRYIYNYEESDLSSYGGVAKYDGIYYFTNASTNANCSVYLTKGTSFSDISFIRQSNTDGCAQYNASFQLSNVVYRRDYVR